VIYAGTAFFFEKKVKKSTYIYYTRSAELADTDRNCNNADMKRTCITGPKCKEQDFVDQFCELTRLGLPRHKCCDKLHINRRTFDDWLQLADRWRIAQTQEEQLRLEPYARFKTALLEAEADFQISALKKIQGLTPDNSGNSWQMWLTLLERRDRNHWQKSETREVTMAPLTAATATDAELEAIAMQGTAIESSTD